MARGGRRAWTTWVAGKLGGRRRARASGERGSYPACLFDFFGEEVDSSRLKKVGQDERSATGRNFGLPTGACHWPSLCRVGLLHAFV